MKKWMIVAAVLTVLGIVLCFVGLGIINFDFSKLNGASSITNSYTIEDAFQNIHVDTDTSNVSLVLSRDGKTRVTVQEWDTTPHLVRVTNGTLEITQQDNRKWYDHIGIFWSETKVELQLPQTQFEALTVTSHTGKTQVAGELSFKAVHVDTNTGFVKLGCAVTETVQVRTSTGSVEIRDAAPASLDVRCSTGKITLANLSVSGALTVNASTGSVAITDCAAQRLDAECDTGKISMTNVLVEKRLQAETSTGDITLSCCDAGSVCLESDTGDIHGTFLTEKLVFAETDTGKIKVPRSTTGGRCDISTDTGDITISF